MISTQPSRQDMMRVPCFIHHPASLDGARSWVLSLPGPITAGAALTALRGEGSHCCSAGAYAAYLIGAAARMLATEAELARERYGMHAYTFEVWTDGRLTGESRVHWSNRPAVARSLATHELDLAGQSIGAGYHERGYCCQDITATREV